MDTGLAFDATGNCAESGRDNSSIAAAAGQSAAACTGTAGCADADTAAASAPGADPIAAARAAVAAVSTE